MDVDGGAPCCWLKDYETGGPVCSNVDEDYLKWNDVSDLYVIFIATTEHADLFVSEDSLDFMPPDGPVEGDRGGMKQNIKSKECFTHCTRLSVRKK